LYLYLEGLKHLPEDEKNGWALYQIANCYNALGNYEKANDHYEMLKKEFPDNFWSEHVGWNQERIQWKEKMKKNGVEW
jgi:TolA-binding protein